MGLPLIEEFRTDRDYTGEKKNGTHESTFEPWQPEDKSSDAEVDAYYFFT